MAKCNLSIEVPGGEDFVAPGGDLDVIVHVSCDTETKCKGLSLTRGWRTHGRGNRQDGGKQMKEVFRGTWEPGEYAYPVKVPFPESPASYHGKVLNVDWYLQARADVPFAFDPKAEAMVLLVDPAPPRAYEPPDLWAPRPIKLKSSVGCSTIVAVIAMPLVVVKAFLSSPSWALFLLPLAAFVYFNLRKSKAATSAMGQVALELHPTSIKPGEELHMMIEFQPEVNIQLEHITATLSANEEATSGSGTDTTTYREEVFKLSQVLARDIEVSSTDRFEEEVAFELPVTAPPSFDKSDNKVTTMLKLEIQPVGGKLVTYHEVIHVGGAKPPEEE
jgi:hypothetical protein